MLVPVLTCVAENKHHAVTSRSGEGEKEEQTLSLVDPPIYPNEIRSKSNKNILDLDGNFEITHAYMF